jgi:glycine dehydrogenase subunit 1
MMGEMLNMDVVNVPTYDWGQAASTSIRMAGRITGRKEILISSAISPDRLLIINNYCKYHLTITMIGYDKKTGKLDIDDLKAKTSEDTAGIYFENPSFFGCIDDQGQEISDIAHDKGALCIVGADPISLGVLVPPADYGADIVCGDIQSLGMHMQYGGGQAGYIATHDKEKFVMEYPSRLFGIETTTAEGEWGFGDVTYDRTSFAKRDDCKEFIGTATALWGITAGVYLALMGPKGMYEVGKLILQKTHYAMKKISEISNVKLRFPKATPFREFVVDFSETGKSVKEINEALLQENIFGGLDLSESNETMDNCALFCITEIHTKEDIDMLADALKKVL